MIEIVRYAMAAIAVIVLPLVIVFWTLFHLTAKMWRGRPIWQPYALAFVVLSLTTAALWSWRAQLVGNDLGTVWWFIVPGLLIYASALWADRRVRRHLTFAIFAGVPEVSGKDTPLLDSGPFSVVRHPRYALVLLATFGWALAANWSGAYLISAICGAALLAVTWLEERDLRARFGATYDDYATRVPMLIPRPQNASRFFT
ncbi:MAG: isoprenylcysteine carboxylmethyltransferase family protein [Pseudomonadota bacterium]